MKSQAKGKSRFRRFAAAAGLIVLVGAGACLASGEDGEQVDEITARELAAQGGHHFRGPVKLVVDAAMAHGNLSAEQEQILTAIELELAGEHSGHRAVGDKLRTSAVEIVRSGTADGEQFEQTLDQAMEVIEARMLQTADAVEEIHATLDAEQRAAVADVLRDHIAERFGRRHHGQHHREGFKRFASHLMLSALQIDKLKAMRKELLGERKRLRPSQEELLALVDAFEGDQFRPAVDAFQTDKSRMMRERFADAGERADTVLSIFTPSQRDLLADLIKDGPRKVLFGDETER